MAATFSKEMLKTHTILVPNMATIQFALIQKAMTSEGMRVEVLKNGGSEVLQQGLRYVHNDTCYPALLIIGQFLSAIRSGAYDTERIILLISQSGGGCRASNYIRLLRKALDKAGYGHIPVVSFNAGGLEKGNSMPISARLGMKLVSAVLYGDELMTLAHQTQPYEKESGVAEKKVMHWINTIGGMFENNKYLPWYYKRYFKAIADDFSAIETVERETIKVGVVGEIYVKFSPLGNSGLEEFLGSQNCEVNMPGLMGYVQYCCANWNLDYRLYGINPAVGWLAGRVLKILDRWNSRMNESVRQAGYHSSGSFYELMKKPEGILSLGAKMGEGWLLTGEMLELIEEGYSNIICVQPFGCLPNHIAGKGVISQIRARYPQANITPVDYDPGATKVNQENRIKLMLAVAKENKEKEDEELSNGII